MINENMQRLGSKRSVIRELFEYGNARAEAIGRENVFDFSLGNPSVPAPDLVREEIARLLEELPAQTLHGYTSAAGLPEVRAAVAEYINAAFGVPVSADTVYMTCGAAASLTILLHALCEAGDEFVAITPCFPEYKVFVEGAGGVLKEARADEAFHLDLAALEAAITSQTKAVIVNSPNNPTGVVYDEAELTALATLLQNKSAEYGRPIVLIADEPYRELTYGAQVPYPMAYYANTAVCYSFSKSLSLAGERIGYIAIHPDCAQAKELFAAVCGAGRSLGYVCAPALFQRVCAKCLGQSSDVGAYKENRDLLYRTLTEAGFECVLPEGAFYLFMKSPIPDAVKFCELAKKHELLLVPSDTFGIEGYVRISYCVEKDIIVRSLPAFRKLAGETILL